jgi:regulator of replication initiation timing
MAPDDPVDELENLDLDDEGDQNQDPVGEEAQGDPADDAPDDVAARQQIQDDRQSQVRQPSRRDTRIQSLIEEGHRRDTENADLRRRLDELASRTAQPQAPRESEAERAARLSTMSTPEVIAETLRDAETRFNQRLNQVTSTTADQVDRTAFQSRASRDPLYARWAPRVETKLNELRSQGVNLDREVLFAYMIGRSSLDKRGSPKGDREVAAAARRVEARRGRPANPGSDTARTERGERNDATARMRRLENVQL